MQQIKNQNFMNMGDGSYNQSMQNNFMDPSGSFKLQRKKGEISRIRPRSQNGQNNKS